jgi:hypothetical protein
VAHDREIVGHEDEGQRQLVLQRLEQIDDLGLDRDVECRHRLVEHDQLRFHRERTGDPDPLALSAGEFMRVTTEVLGVQADTREQFARARLELRAWHAGQPQRRREDLAHALARVQRRLRVLEDHLHVAAHGHHPPPRSLGDVLAAKPHRSAGRRLQPREAADQGRLSAAGLTDDPERLALVQRERHVGDRVHLPHLAVQRQAAANREVDLQVLSLEQRRAGAHTLTAPAASPISPSTTRRRCLSAGSSQQRSS